MDDGVIVCPWLYRIFVEFPAVLSVIPHCPNMCYKNRRKRASNAYAAEPNDCDDTHPEPEDGSDFYPEGDKMLRFVSS